MSQLPRRYAFVPALLVILVATLVPAGVPDAPYSFWAPAALADILRNIVLFAPLGAALAWRGQSLRRVVLLSLATTLFVESCQMLLPGRDPSLFDLAANTLGGWAGAAAFYGGLRARRAPGWAASLAALVCGGVILGTVWLMRPALPQDQPWFGQWTPNLGHFDWYRGHMRQATLGGELLPPSRLPDTPGARQRLLEGAELSVLFTAGPPTRDLAPLASIFDAGRREIMLLAVHNTDVIWRLRPRAAALALESPFLRWPGRLAGAAPGDTVTLRLRGAVPGYCLSDGSVDSCQSLLLRDGWMIYVAPDFPAYRLHTAIAFTFLALLAVPVGLLLSGRGPALVALAIFAAAVLAAPPIGGLAVAGFFEWGALIAGLAAGQVLRRAAPRHYPVV